jgi:small subunit ribosomal protein S7
MTAQKLLLFRKWDISEIEIQDIGLKTAISLKEAILPMSFGRSALKRFNKADVNIVERLVNKMMHFGKKNMPKILEEWREKNFIPSMW